MKKILMILLSCFLLSGCSSKKETYEDYFNRDGDHITHDWYSDITTDDIAPVDYDITQYSCDINGDGQDERIIKVGSVDEDYYGDEEYLVYTIEDGKVVLKDNFENSSNGEDDTPYYDEEDQVIAVLTRGSDNHWIQFYSMKTMNGDKSICFRYLGYVDQKEQQYTRHYYDGDVNMESEDFFEDNKEYEIASYNWDDEKAQEDAIKVYNQHLPELTAMKELEK